jgi:hypothetical protein
MNLKYQFQIKNQLQRIGLYLFQNNKLSLQIAIYRNIQRFNENQNTNTLFIKDKNLHVIF